MLDNFAVPTQVEIPSINGPFGSIGVIEGDLLIPFAVNRMYFIHSVPEGAERGSHAHKVLKQLITCVHGSLKLSLTDGSNEFDFVLNNPKIGVVVPPGFWRTLTDFSANTVCVVLASHVYDESDYIRDYDEFLAWRRS
jgi:dTDP-4-dehydrorhamnose 3,5-epimerase-like enzyme